MIYLVVVTNMIFKSPAQDKYHGLKPVDRFLLLAGLFRPWSWLVFFVVDADSFVARAPAAGRFYLVTFDLPGFASLTSSDSVYMQPVYSCGTKHTIVSLLNVSSAYPLRPGDSCYCSLRRRY